MARAFPVNGAAIVTLVALACTAYSQPLQHQTDRHTLEYQWSVAGQPALFALAPISVATSSFAATAAQWELPDLPVIWDENVVRLIHFYRDDPRGRAIMTTWLKRQDNYRGLILSELAAQNLPQDLLYVAMIESGYDPAATSRADAGGIWQFMPHVGRAYGLEQNLWIDRRRDPEHATRAAVRYLKELYDRFGHWHLALAAYNAGDAAVAKAIQKYNTNDYWKLCTMEAGLPWDTTLYVPRILAAAVVGRNRVAFGFEASGDSSGLSVSRLTIPSSLTLDQIAEATGISSSAIAAANPELRRNRTPPGAPYELKMPRPIDATRVIAALQRIASESPPLQPYRIRVGETEKSLARQFNVSRANLLALNGLRSATELTAGETILVPSATTTASAPASSPQSSTAAAIAVPVPQEFVGEQPGKRRVFYQVTRGDALSVIAENLHVRAADLMRWNGLDSHANLLAGMTLQAFVVTDVSLDAVTLLPNEEVRVVPRESTEFLEQTVAQGGRIRVRYKVRSNDTLALISRRFGLSVGSIMRINRFGPRTVLKKDDWIVLYIDLERAKKYREYFEASDQKRLQEIAETAGAAARSKT